MTYGNTCGSGDVIYKFIAVTCNPYPPHDNIVTGGRFMVAPNPAQNTITISPAGDNRPVTFRKVPDNDEIGKTTGGISAVRLYTLSGKLVRRQKVAGNPVSLQIDVSGLAPGVYFIEISDSRQRNEVHKVVISQ